MHIHPLLLPYVPMVEFFGQVVGENCEVLLSDLTKQTPSVVAIANGHVTNRSIGSPLSDATLEIIRAPEYKEQEYIANYPSVTFDGKRSLRSSACRIRNEEGETIGVFCVNFDITDLLAVNKMLTKFPFISACQGVSQKAADTENRSSMLQEMFSPSIEESLYIAVDRLLREYSVSPDRLTKAEKEEVVQQMYNRGLFTFKGSVALLAKEMSVSEQTIYRYLRECQHKN